MRPPSHTLYAAVLETRNYVVGAANAPSGLYRRDGADWTHLGWRNVRAFDLLVDADDPAVLYLASGNGVLRSGDGGATWRVTTDWRITEVLALTAGAGRLYAATAHGIWRSEDAAATWLPFHEGLGVPRDTFVQTIATDRTTPHRVLAGTESGLHQSDGASAWTPVGPRVPIRVLRQSPHTPECWMAATEDYGLLQSTDAGATWQAVPDVPTSATFYAVAYDATKVGHLAAAGFQTGLWLSRDGGRSWSHQPLFDPHLSVHALAFDVEMPGRLWVGLVGAGLMTTDDGGRTFSDVLLPETTVYALAFG